MMSNKQTIDIVMTTWQREWMTNHALMALRQNTKYPYRLILIDSGSNEKAQAHYTKEADIYVKLDKNQGLEHAKHIGMSFVESPLFVSTDNDILVYKNDPDWLSRLIGLMKTNPDYGAIALRPQVLVADTMRMFETDADLVDFPRVPGYGRIMRTDLVNAVGAWKDERPLRGHEEVWIGEKFKEAGWKMAWANKVKCWHLFGEDDTDGWGYLKDSDPESHGHHPVWPMPKNDRETIRKEVGIPM